VVSVDPGDAVHIGRLRVGIRRKRARAVRRSQLAEEALESGRGGRDQQPSLCGHHATLGMRHTPWEKDDTARVEAELLIAALVDVLSLKHVEQLVVRMDVPLGAFVGPADSGDLRHRSNAG
jgi:hypothetical protein